MTLGLIAAGEGSRLRREGYAMPKGLVPVGGVPMVRRTIEAFVRCGVTSVVAIVNEESPELAEYLRTQDFGVPLHLLVRSTPSSMHSLFALAPQLQSGPFFLATVDAIYHRNDLAEYVSHCAGLTRLDDREQSTTHGVLAVTRLIEDEKPLHVAIDSEHRIQAIGEAASGSGWVTAGLYFFSPEVFEEIPTAHALRMERLRNFQGLLVEKGYRIYGHPFGDVVDVDHRADILRAEELLSQWEAEA